MHRNEGEPGWISGPGTKILHAPGQLSPQATNYWAHTLVPSCCNCWSPCSTMRSPCTITREWPPLGTTREMSNEEKQCLKLNYIIFFFLKFIYFLLKDNCFTEFCCFLTNLDMNQPAIGIHISPPFWNSLPSPSPSHPASDTEPLFEFPEPHSKFPLGIYFTYGNVVFHVTLSIHLTLSSLSPCL